MTLW
ncbi:hypothetical protein E2C01_098379 [Portunus trituberculatus]|jgi:hypothetical protein